jgi:molybdate transport system substrate-binding protein
MNILSAGAAKGLLQTIGAAEGIELNGEFGAVGAIKERLQAGAPCDVIVLTAAMITELATAGAVDAASVTQLGRVHTGVALLASSAAMQINDVASLRDLCANASKIYFPDPVRATAGIHCLKVLTALGLVPSHEDRFATFPSGAIAMRAMADAGDAGEAGAIGITQCSEILYTDGVQYAGALPESYALSTVYTAAIIRDAQNAPEARRLLAALSALANVRTVRDAGFEAV